MFDISAPYLVSTGQDGRKRWWKRQADIPADHRDVRASTEQETALMDELLATDANKGEPSDAAAASLRALLDANP